MNYKELAEKRQEQIEVLTKSVDTLTANFTSVIDALKQKVEALEVLLLKEDKDKKILAARLNGLTKISLPKKIEKQKVKNKDSNKPAPTAKERGNNGAKRKELNITQEIIDVEPTDELFNAEKARFIAYRDVIRYEFIPSKLIKRIYRCRRYTVNGDIYEGKAPETPLLNSQYSSSFIAYLMQQRYVYGMPIERIMCYLQEMGVDIPKPTLHGLVRRSAEMLDIIKPVLRRAIFESDYVHFDETYHTILDKNIEKGSRKGYFWVAMAHESKLIHFFYNEGSRSTKVFKEYLPCDYMGTIQTDGYISYKIVDGMAYPGVVRVGCIQHCKRYFNDIKTQPQAKRIICLYNKFYQIRHKKKKEDWVNLSIKVYDELEDYLRKLDKDPRYMGNSILKEGITYCLNELYSIYNIISNTEYDLDNNDIERPMRYISISRKNSMFCGSDKGAERSALIYSLAISCRLNNINSYEYFNDMIMKIYKLPPNASYKVLRELLPDKWAENH